MRLQAFFERLSSSSSTCTHIRLKSTAHFVPEIGAYSEPIFRYLIPYKWLMFKCKDDT